MAYDPDNGYVYVVTADENITVINGTTIVTTISGGNTVVNSSECYPLGTTEFAGLAYDPADGYMYAVDGNSGCVWILNGTTVQSFVPVGRLSSDAAYDPQDGDIYVAKDLGGIVIINGTRTVGSMAVAQVAGGIAYDPADGDLYIGVNPGGGGPPGYVQVANSTAVIGTANGSGWSTPVFDAATGNMYIGNGGGNYALGVSIVNGTSLVSTIYPGMGFASGAYDPINQYVYLTNESGSEGLYSPQRTDNVVVVNGTSVVASITVGVDPGPAVFDPRDGEVYVSNTGSSYLSLIPGSFYYAVASVHASLSTVEINSTNASSALSVGVTGGVPSEPYSITYLGLPPGCASSGSAYDLCTPSRAGSYVVRVLVNQSIGSGLTTSSIANVSLTVVAALTVSARASLSPTDAGSMVNFSSTSSGGVGPWTFAWRFGDGNSSSSQNTSHKYATPGSYTVRLWVNDSYGGHATDTLVVLVDPSLEASLSISNNTLALGSTIAITVEASGGSPPYFYEYHDLPPGCVSENSSSLGCLPTQAGFYNVTVSVMDRNGIYANVTAPLEVVFEFKVVAPGQVAVHQTLTVSVTPEGGYAPFTYAYAGLPPGCVSANTSQLRCTPLDTGAYDVLVSVRDAIGDHASDHVEIEVVPGHGSSLILTNPWVLGGLSAVVVGSVIAAVVVYSSRRGGSSPSPDPYAQYRIGRSGSSLSDSEMARGVGNAGTDTHPSVARYPVTDENNDSLSDLI